MIDFLWLYNIMQCFLFFLWIKEWSLILTQSAINLDNNGLQGTKKIFIIIIESFVIKGKASPLLLLKSYYRINDYIK